MATVNNIQIRNAAVASGFETKEIGAEGYNINIRYDANGKAVETAEERESLEEWSDKSLAQVLNNTPPTDHSAEDTKYGAASTDKFGHIKISTGLEAEDGVVSVKYGSDAGTACQGNDSRLSDDRKNPNALKITSGNDTLITYDGSKEVVTNAEGMGAAPKSHTSVKGTGSTLGHVTLSDDYYSASPSSSASGASASIAASLYAVQQAYKNSLQILSYDSSTGILKLRSTDYSD